LLQILVDKITKIKGISHTETFQISLDEVFSRQLTIFDDSVITKQED
jgi:Lrp/AsnC family transcriptional regulator for asnA, asnC and gidA